MDLEDYVTQILNKIHYYVNCREYAFDACTTRHGINPCSCRHNTSDMHCIPKNYVKLSKYVITKIYSVLEEPLKYRAFFLACMYDNLTIIKFIEQKYKINIHHMINTNEN